MEILAIIPARSGSKSVKNKNIRILNGKPMMAYSIEHALSCSRINRVIVSTDSEKYASIARQHGAEVPFIRPEEISGDESLDIEVFEHALKFLKENEDYIPDIVVQLRPTYPIRCIEDINNTIKMLIENETADSIRCLAPAKETPYKMWTLNDDGLISPILRDIPEAYNMPRQKLPKVYSQNACIDVVRYRTIIDMHSMTGKNIMGYVMNTNFDIDTEEEFVEAENYLKYQKGELKNKKFVFDIDGVVAKIQPELKYDMAEPDIEMIQVINRLYSLGNQIVLFTARGYKSGVDWKEVTIKQLKKWGVKYNELIFGKPDADYYIDDKMLSIDAIRKFLK